MNKDLLPYQKSIAAYKKVGIEIEVLELKEEIPVVLIKQRYPYNGYILNQKQLVKRAKTLFSFEKIHVKTSVYSLDLNDITMSWIKEKMTEFELKQNDFIKLIALDNTSLRLIFSEEQKLPNQVKVAFYYLFLTFEINKQFRESTISI